MVNWTLTGSFSDIPDGIASHTVSVSGYGLPVDVFCDFVVLFEWLSDHPEDREKFANFVEGL